MALMKKLTSAIVASSLVLSLVGTAAATTPDKVQASATRMAKLGLVKGVGADGDLALNANITRAQLVTILVRAFGQDASAKFLNGAAAFPDTANHPWASGYIALSKNIIEQRSNGKESVGLPDGTFNPEGNVTAAEAVAFLMKFTGAPKDASLSWPENYIQGALNAGFITAEDKAVLGGIKNAPATRGLAFYLADSAFYGYKLAEGSTVYATFVDNVKPAMTVEAPATTLDESVTVTGTVAADAVAVRVGSVSNLATITNGKFTATVKLAVGENTIAVSAIDLAGNASEQTVKVTRTVGTAAAIEASDITVTAGATADVAVAVKDAKGNTIADAAVTGESTVGTFAAGKFTAGTTAGESTLTIKSGELTKTVKVTVTAGALTKIVATPASAKVGERVTLTAQDQYGNKVSGATFSSTDTDALLDGAQGVFIASKAKSYTVTATKGEAKAETAIGVYSTTVAKLVASAPAQVVGNTDAGYNGSDYEVTVKAVDANGNLVASYDRAISLTLPTGFTAGTDEIEAAGVITKAAKAGVATFKVRASVALVGQLVDFATFETTLADATVIGDVASEKAKASIEVIEQVATKVAFGDVSSQFIRANDGQNGAANVNVYLVDQNGKRFLGQLGYVINLSVSGAAKINTGKTTDTAVYAGAPINVTIDSIKAVTGEAVITATVDGIGTATAKTTAAIAGDAALVTLKANKTEATANDVTVITYTARVVDKNGVPVIDSPELTVAINSDEEGEFTVTGNATALVDAAATNKSTFTVQPVGGVATFTLSANTFVGDLNVTIQDSAKDLTASTASTKVVADVPASFELARTTQIDVAATAPKASLSVQVYDAAGNKAPVAGLKIKFAGNSDVKFNGTAEQLEVLTDANGVATVEADVLAYVGTTYNITVTGKKADGTALASVANTVAIYVDNSIATTLSTAITYNGNPVVSVKAGETIVVTVTAKDAFGKVVAGNSLKLIPAGKAYLPADLVNAISKTAGTAMADNGDGTYTVSVVPATTGTFSFTIKDVTPGTALTSTASLRVTPAVASQLVVNNGDPVTVKRNTASGAITVQLADTFGNAALATAKLTLNISPDNTGIRTSVGTADVIKLTMNAGTSASTFYVYNSLAAGTYTVTFAAVDAVTGANYNDANGAQITGDMTLTIEN